MQFKLHFRNLHKALSILEKKFTLIASILPKLLILKKVVTWMPESFCFRTPFGSPRVNGSKTLLKSARQPFYDNFPLKSNKLSCLSCLIVRSVILGPFFNTLTTDQMYSCHKWDKFPQQAQTELSSKPKLVCQNIIAYLKSP